MFGFEQRTQGSGSSWFDFFKVQDVQISELLGSQFAGILTEINQVVDMSNHFHL